MKPRAGYTLLEMILALAIGLLLVSALYVTMDMQFRSMQSGREVVAGAQLARGLLGRVAADVRLSLGLLSSMSTQQQKYINSASGTTSSSTTSTSSTSGTSSSTSSQTSTATPPGQFSSGIVGDQTQITLFLSAVPHYSQDTAQVQTGLSDIRPISYSFVPGAGLVRHRYRSPVASVSDGSSFIGSLEEAAPPEVLASEVVDLHFRYFDATSAQWVASWDGTAVGPPQAVEITMAVEPSPLTLTRTSRLKPPTYYRTVVAVPTAAISQAVIDQQAGVTP